MITQKEEEIKDLQEHILELQVKIKQQELAMKKGSEVEASILAGLSEQEKERYASDAEFKKQKIKEVLAAEAGISDEKLKILEQAYEEEQRLNNENYRKIKYICSTNRSYWSYRWRFLHMGSV